MNPSFAISGGLRIFTSRRCQRPVSEWMPDWKPSSTKLPSTLAGRITPRASEVTVQQRLGHASDQSLYLLRLRWSRALRRLSAACRRVNF